MIKSQDIELIENIIRTARKGRLRAACDLDNAMIDIFQHIEDEALRLLPDDHRFRK